MLSHRFINKEKYIVICKYSLIRVFPPFASWLSSLPCASSLSPFHLEDHRLSVGGWKTCSDSLHVFPKPKFVPGLFAYSARPKRLKGKTGERDFVALLVLLEARSTEVSPIGLNRGRALRLRLYKIKKTVPVIFQKGIAHVLIYVFIFICVCEYGCVFIIFGNLLSFIVFAHADKSDCGSSLYWAENERQT